MRRLLFSAFVFMFISLSTYHPEVNALACGVAGCAEYGCNSGLSCRSANDTCGITYNVCGGATNTTCQADTGWDTTAPCDNPDECTGTGTRTATWTFGACTTNCGNTNTRLATCTCSSNNTCPITCTSPVGTCAGTRTDTTCACVNGAPLAPTVVGVTPTYTTNGSTTVSWTFGWSTGCATSWGYACSGGSETFTIKDGVTIIASNISSAARSSLVTLSGGAHSIRVCADNGPLETCSTPVGITTYIDNTAPLVPGGGVVTFNADPTCLDKYIPTYSWNVTTDAGVGLDTAPYNPHASSIIGFGSLLNGWSDTWISATNKSPTSSYPPGTPLYFRVRARDSLGTVSNWSPTLAPTVPAPSPYPTIHIAGTFTEVINSVCYPGTTFDANSLSLSPVLNPSVGGAVTCTKTNTSYSCNITIDNTQGLCVSPNTTISLNATYPGYSTVDWRTGEICTGGTKDWTLAVGEDRPSIPLFFSYDSEGTGGWFKLSQASYNSRMSGRTNYIPNTISPYDADDTTANRYMIIGTDGSIAQNNPVVIGPANTAYSQNNWYTSGYTHTSDVSYLQYIDYIKARKDVITITSPDLSQINSDGIYSISAPVVLDETRFDGKKVVLVVQGASATFNTNFVPVNGSVAVLAKDIIIDPSVTEINGILIGQTVATGASTNGLKIKGNLVDEEAMEIERVQNDARKPSLFVVFDIVTYLNVLPYLSTSTYDWKQLQ